MNLTTDLRVVPRLSMGGAMTVLPVYAFITSTGKILLLSSSSCSSSVVTTVTLHYARCTGCGKCEALQDSCVTGSHRFPFVPSGVAHSDDCLPVNRKTCPAPDMSLRTALLKHFSVWD